jgi:hypothetical protein
MRRASLILILCLAPGAAITIYSLITAYQAMGAGDDVDAEKLRTGAELGLKWLMIGVGVAFVLLFLQTLYRLRRSRRPR